MKCAECGGQLFIGAIADLNGLKLHPVNCFGKALAKWRKAVDTALEKNLGTIDLKVRVDSATPAVVRQLAELAGNVRRARRAAR